jgi:NADH-quinone oxidoreductase subunit K
MTVFYIFGAIAVGASLLVIGQRNPVYSVLLLIASFGALSGLYVLLDAPFVAVIQIIVYAGAIMVLFLFVVMLLNAPAEETEYDQSVHPLLRPGPMRFGALLACALAAELVWALTRRGQLGARDWPLALHQVRVRLRGDVGPHSGRDVGCRGARQAGAVMPTLTDYLVLSALLFAIGTAGVFIRRNLITILLSIEIMLNAVNLTFVAFGRALGSSDGQIIVFFVMTVAAAEAAVGLAIVIALYRHRESLNPDTFTALKW